MRALANSEDPDELPLNAAFHQGLHRKRFSEKEIQFHLEIISFDPQYIQWIIPSVLFQTRRKSPLTHKRVTQPSYRSEG